VVYVFDTNSFRVLGNYYPARFPTLWHRFNDAVARGLVISVREVYNELDLQLQDGWLRDWVEDHRGLYVSPTAEETVFLTQIFSVRHFQALVGEKQRLKGQPVADPFIPTWNIETWLAYLDGAEVDEGRSDYPRLDRERECQRHVEKLIQMCDAGKLREPSPLSLDAACSEYRTRLR
jgi:hypothetical protein